MDTGQLILIISRLSLGAIVAFFAILLWSRTRDIAWMLMVIGAIAAYVDIVYSILVILGITVDDLLYIGSIPVISIVLPNLPVFFIAAAFSVMVFRKYRWR